MVYSMVASFTYCGSFNASVSVLVFSCLNRAADSSRELRTSSRRADATFARDARHGTHLRVVYPARARGGGGAARVARISRVSSGEDGLLGG